jgi:hypothetical protein
MLYRIGLQENPIVDLTASCRSIHWIQMNFYLNPDELNARFYSLWIYDRESYKVTDIALGYIEPRIIVNHNNPFNRKISSLHKAACFHECIS